jgi:hypothetical protein
MYLSTRIIQLILIINYTFAEKFFIINNDYVARSEWL